MTGKRAAATRPRDHETARPRDHEKKNAGIARNIPKSRRLEVPQYPVVPKSRKKLSLSQSFSAILSRQKKSESPERDSEDKKSC